MTILDLSSLNSKNVQDIYYMESLSLDNLPKGVASTIGDSIFKIMQYNQSTFKKYFSENLGLFNPSSSNPHFHTEIINDNHMRSTIDLSLIDIDTSNSEIVFSAHDLKDVKIKINLQDNGIIHFKANGDSHVDYANYDLNATFSGLSNYKSEFSEYSKGQKISERECDFSIIYDKYDFMFREIVFEENSKLEGEIKFVFIATYFPKHSDIGERKILTLSFTPEQIEYNFAPHVLQEKNISENNHKRKFKKK